MKKFLNAIAAFAAGVTTASLWITHSDNWKIALPVALLCITLRAILDE